MYTNQPRIICRVFVDFLHHLWICVKPSRYLAAENLFLRNQLALFQERKIKPRSTDPATRLTMAFLSQRLDWRDALMIVQPGILLRWHLNRFKELWRRKSQPGRPPISPKLQRLIRRMAAENVTWGEERIDNELLVKLGVSVSPRTIRKYMPKRSGHTGPRGDQSWSTFLKNHANAIVDCNICTVVIMNFRVLYVFVLIEHGTRRLFHSNVTENPTADWACQQLREAVLSDHEYQYLIHDGDCIFSAEFDTTVCNFAIMPIKTPYRSPKANAICERMIGTIRRECLDYVIPLTQIHLKRTMKIGLRITIDLDHTVHLAQIFRVEPRKRIVGWCSCTIDSSRNAESFPHQYLADYITTIDLCVHSICGAQGPKSLSRCQIMGLTPRTAILLVTMSSTCTLQALSRHSTGS